MWPFRFAMHGRRGLRTMVVSLLSSSPKNGVEIMDGVEAMTRGWWRPTPGSVYPLLSKMVEEGTIKKRDQDGRYELTPVGKSEFSTSFGPGFRRPHTAHEVISEMQSYVSFMEDLKNSRSKDWDQHRGEVKKVAERLSALVEKEGADTQSKP
jgi:DNA-binding PadR family transcriptional regulator